MIAGSSPSEVIVATSRGSVAGGPLRPKTVGELVLGAVRKHANGRAQNDDIALVCFGRVDDVPTANFKS